MTELDDAARNLVDPLLRRCTFPSAGSRVTCAVSGGADSTALAVMAVQAGCEVTLMHVDHGLRPGSAAEANVVAELAHRLGARFQSVTVEVVDGPNLEARSRDARRAVLPADALYGHTADDQAETVLMAIMRGAGLDGLAGMRAQHHPILGLRRVETVAVCRFLGLPVVDDPSNLDPRFVRNRVRHELLPLLNDLANRDVAEIIARQCLLVGDDVAMLDSLADALDPTDAKALTLAPPSLARRAVRSWLRGEHPPSSNDVERVLAVARGEAKACEVAGGVRIERHSQRLAKIVTSGPA